MIEQAKSKKLPHADFIVGDCENLPFAENSFDVRPLWNVVSKPGLSLKSLKCAKA
jgi:SAM-dependent methyltransferase